MRRSTVLFLALAAIELLLVLGGIFMVMQVHGGAWNAPDPAEAIRRIGTVIGGAIPLVALVFLLIAVPLRRRGL